MLAREAPGATTVRHVRGRCKDRSLELRNTDSTRARFGFIPSEVAKMLRTADPDLRRQPRPTRTANRSAW